MQIKFDNGLVTACAWMCAASTYRGSQRPARNVCSRAHAPAIVRVFLLFAVRPGTPMAPASAVGCLRCCAPIVIEMRVPGTPICAPESVNANNCSNVMEARWRRRRPWAARHSATSPRCQKPSSSSSTRPQRSRTLTVRCAGMPRTAASRRGSRALTPSFGA